MKRGEIWWADLDDPVGSEPGFSRPLLVVQADSFNASRIATVLVVVITGNTRLAQAPGNVLLPTKKTGLASESVANVSQVLTINKSRLRDHLGSLDASLLGEVEDGLRLVLAL